MNGAGAIAFRRILLALDGLTEDPAMLSAAVELAARLHVELVGLFIEDADLLRSAALPFVHQIDVLTGEPAAFERETTERELRQSAERAEKRLVREAERLHVRCTFRTVRGSIAGSVREAAGEADLVVLSEASRSPGAALPIGRHTRTISEVSRPVLVLRSGIGLAGPVLAILDEEEKAERVLDWAVRLAARDGSDVHVLATLPRFATPPPRNEVRFHVHAVRGHVLEALVQHVESETAGVVVLASTSPLLAAPGVETLLARVSRALLIVH